MSTLEKVLLWGALGFLGASILLFLNRRNELGAIHTALIALCMIQLAIAIR